MDKNYLFLFWLLILCSLFCSPLFLSGCAQGGFTIIKDVENIKDIKTKKEIYEWKEDGNSVQEGKEIKQEPANSGPEPKNGKNGRRNLGYGLKSENKPGDRLKPDDGFEPKSEKEGKEQTGEEPVRLLSNVFYDTDLREIIRNLSAETGENLITDDTVQGIISIKYEKQPLDKVLKIILSPGGYTFRKMENYYLIGSPDPRSPLFNYLTKTVSVKPRFLKAKEIMKLISPSFATSIQINEERNLLTITASHEMVERILEDIKTIDTIPRQVNLEAVIIELSSEARKKLGIDWSGESSKFSASMQGLDMGFGYMNTSTLTRQITSQIHALLDDGLASIKATPRITTMDGEEARINIDLEQYVSITSGPAAYPYSTVQTIKAGITLNIVPFISDDNTITVKIKPAEVSDVVGIGKDDLPLINKRSVNTTVVVNNNETIAIGGLLKKREFDRIMKVPVLGHIPILNLFFKKREKVTEDSEVLIFITPRVIEDGEQQF